MLVEMRTYTFRPGTLAPFLELYEAEGLALHTGHLGRLLGYFTTESGELHQAVHIWGYEDHADRETRRRALNADPDWAAFARKAGDIVVRMETRFLSPAPFSPMR